MTQDEFNKLKSTDKLQFIFDYGEELGLRHNEGFTIKLYQLEDFFCEVWYSSEANQIYNIEVTDSINIASLYPIKLNLDNSIKN